MGLGIIIVKVAELFTNFVAVMRYFITTIILIFSLSGFAQDENKTDAKGKKQGLWKKYHKNGMLRYEGSFKDDNPVGVFKYYYDTGELQVKMTNIGKNAYSNVYYETGELKATGKYENQKKDSTWTFYDREGYKMAEEFYLSGKAEGTWKVYFPTGKIAEEKEYTDGEENGKWTRYYANGKIKMTAIYENGVLEGRATYYGNNFKKAVSGPFHKNVRHGFWTYYEADGKTVRKKEQYSNGVRIDKNKDDDVIDDREIEYIPENVLSPENFLSPR